MNAILKGLLISAGLLAVVPAASAADDFYAGKTITVVVGLSAGGGYDLYARVMAEHLGKHIPGHPNVVVENRPGAATRTATAYVYGVAPHDGTVIGNSLNMLPLDQIIFPKQRRYDLTKVQFLGNIAGLTSVIAVSNKSPMQTVDDITKKVAKLGSNGKNSETYIIPALINSFIGGKFEIILGFRGVAGVDLAIERGEIDGRGGSWNSFRSLHPDWIKANKIKPLMQIGATDDPFMPGVPQLSSLAKTDEQKAIFSLLSHTTRFTRAYWVAPEVPKDRVKILRDAFMATMKDPEFLAAAKKANMEVSPSSPEEIEVALHELANTPPEYLKKMKDVLSK
jgi:tripartite-type tricarboxylate transporter receptor subunit TctC